MTHPDAVSQYGAPTAAYRPAVRPPLTRREKRGAFWSGAVGFNLITLGFTLVMIPIVVGLFGAFINFLVEGIARSSEHQSTGFLAMLGVIRSIDFGVVAILGVAVALVGLAIMAGAIFLSRGILRSHGVARPAPVTWAGAGIAIAATWIVGWIPGVITQLAFGSLASAGVDSVNAAIVVGAIGMILGIGFTGVIGWLAWWWMAHAFRSAAQDNSAMAEVQE